MVGFRKPRPPGAGGAPPVVTGLDLPLPRARSGKVRECFDVGDRLLLVATDRISAFDCVFSRGIPGKGGVLTGISRFWFEALDAGAAGSPPIEHHLLSADTAEVVRELGLPEGKLPELAGRTMLVRKADPIPIECVVRGFLEGSALKEYQESGRVAGIKLPPGLRRADRLRDPLFTPARKAAAGHDEDISFDRMVSTVGGVLASRLRELSLQLYAMGAAALSARGLLLADTKFEFGLLPRPDGQPASGPGAPFIEDGLLLIDELLTPDSSRLWDAEGWEPGHAQPSFDKQPLRDYLEGLVREGKWDKRPPAPELSDGVVNETADRYAQAHVRITGFHPERWRSAVGDLTGSSGFAEAAPEASATEASPAPVEADRS